MSLIDASLIKENRKINLYFSGEITITSGHKRFQENPHSNKLFSSKERKGYSIKSNTRRLLLSSAFNLFAKKKHGIVFLTLTFPDDPDKGVKINPMLNRFITNMKKNYGLKGYLWTRENQKTGRPHYHILCDMPFMPIQKINNAWCAATGMFSKNAVRLPKRKGVVKDMDSTCRYISKYITKEEFTFYSERCWGISKDVRATAVKLDEFDLQGIIEEYGDEMKFSKYEHCTVIKIWDFFSKSNYFIDFLDYMDEVILLSDSNGGRTNTTECKMMDLEGEVLEFPGPPIHIQSELFTKKIYYV